MKRLSIRTRIMIWYIVMLMVFLYLGVAASYNATRNILMEQNREGMQRGSAMLAERIAEASENDAGSLSLGDAGEKIPGDLSYILYNPKNDAVAGRYQDWMAALPQRLGQLHIVEHHGRYWACYDNLIYKNNELMGWLRSVREMTTTFELLKEMRYRGTLAIIPSLMLSALGGLFITRWALNPIKKIAKTAREIGAGDLSKRIELDTAKDEVGELLVEFNHMADNLEKVVEREKQFSSDASHEIRTPISVIITNAEYAIQSRDLNTCLQALGLVINKSRQMQHMLSQLLTLARGHEQTETMELETLDLGSIIEDIAEERLARAQEKEIRIKNEAEKGVMVKADLMLLSRMITNLLDNAIQYGRTGGYVHISTYRDLERNTAVILVIDNGIGIAEEELPLIFDRFYRVDKSRSRAGSGLGLSLVDFIVKLHRGEISVDSHPGEGTCFKIELPPA